MRGYIERVMHPERYHGHNRQPPFFEGWYFKLIDATEQHRYAVIPGIFLSHDAAKHHAFVQVLDGQTGESAYFSYPPEQFRAAADDFDVWVGPNHFRADGIRLRLEGEHLALQGELRFEGLVPWPVRWSAPGIMGPFGWLTFMECYHGVVSLDHTIRGELRLDGQTLRFDGGQGYIEKDWGESFPSSYIWMQSNHFAQGDVCLTASIAHIPFKAFSFPGYIVGFWQDGVLHRFTTYTGARLERLRVTDQHVEWVLSNSLYRLELFATRSRGGLLHGPTRVEMHKRIMETLQATIEVRLTDVKMGRERFNGVGRNGGLEVFGDLSGLVK